MRKPTEVVGELLRAMDKTVVSYHPAISRTSSTIEGLIQGTAFFPGGAGLWRGKWNNGPLPDCFPESPIMFVGHNFDSVRGYEVSRERGGEVEGQFWGRLLRMLDAAHIRPESCFFTNALMGLKPGKATGSMPSVHGYKKQCQTFLGRQVEIVKPLAIVALGVQAIKYVSPLHGRHAELRHPGDWCFSELETRDALLAGEGQKLRKLLGSVEARKESATPEVHLSIIKLDERALGMEKEDERVKKTKGSRIRGDAWGFRFGTRNSFLMEALEKGGKSKEQIKIEFLHRFPGSVGKSTFTVFFSDVVRPFGSASVSRCVRIESDQHGRLHLDPERATQIKAVIAAGILDEINAVEGKFPKKDQQALDTIVEKYRAPRT